MNISNESTTLDVLKATIGKSLRAIKDFKNYKKLASRKSIMSMAAPGLYQYPLIISPNIDTTAKAVITKALQLNFASTIITAYSLNPVMYLEDTPELSDFVQRFHQNENIDDLATFNPNAANRALFESTTELGLESATLTSLPPREMDVLNMTSWGRTDDLICTESLNDMYKPYDRTKRIIKERLAAMEEYDNGLNVVNNIGAAINDINNRPYATNVPIKTRTINSRTIGGNTDEVKKESRTVVPTHFNEVVNSRDASEIEPTMINVQVKAYGKDATGTNGQGVFNITLGVKVMPRVVPSSQIINSLGTAVKEVSRRLFLGLTWTRGEIGTIDKLLGISSARKNAQLTDDPSTLDYLLFKQLKKRKTLGGLSKIFNNEVFPTTTIIITSDEAYQIKEATGIDLMEIRQALRLMDRYYILGFGVFDTTEQVLQVVFDGEKAWHHSTVNTIAAQTKMIKDLKAREEITNIFGRR